MFDIQVYPTIKGKIEITKAIKSVISSIAKTQPKLHQALFSAVIHAMETNDTTGVSMLWNGVGNSVNKKNGIAIWLKAYTNLSLRKAKDGEIQWLKPVKDKQVTFKMEGIDMPFYDMPEVDKANKPFDLFTAFRALVSKAEKKAEGEEVLPEAQLAFLKQLEALIPALPQVEVAA